MSKSWGEIREEALRRCGQLPPKTNADRIRAMSVEEMAEFMKSSGASCPDGHFVGDYDCKDCKNCWLDWLLEEVSTDG